MTAPASLPITDSRQVADARRETAREKAVGRIFEEIGLNPETVQGLIALTGNERFAWDAWRRFVAMFGRIVLGLKAEDFDEPFDELKKKAGAKQGVEAKQDAQPAADKAKVGDSPRVVGGSLTAARAPKDSRNASAMRCAARAMGPRARRRKLATGASPVSAVTGGGIEAVACIKAMRESWVPPTVGLDDPDPECDLDYVPNEAREHEVAVGMSNSFGFGGHNASLLMSINSVKGDESGMTVGKASKVLCGNIPTDNATVYVIGQLARAGTGRLSQQSILQQIAEGAV